MDISQLYMLALRPTMVPIVGESADSLFRQQVEISEWDWEFHNEDEQADQRGAGAGATGTANQAAESAQEMEATMRRFSPRDLDNLRGQRRRENERLRGLVLRPNSRLTTTDFSTLDRLERRITTMERQQSNLLQQAIRQSRQLADQVNEAAEESEATAQDTATGAGGATTTGATAAEEAKNYSFNFSKRLDISTTQFLNCMKNGDVLPVVTLTMHQSSSNTPWTLVITITNMRITSYRLDVSPDETMTDTKETWGATYDSFGYVYKNRPHAGTQSLTAGGATQTAAKAATQGTVRTFMRKKMLF